MKSGMTSILTCLCIQQNVVIFNESIYHQTFGVRIGIRVASSIVDFFKQFQEQSQKTGDVLVSRNYGWEDAVFTIREKTFEFERTD